MNIQDKVSVRLTQQGHLLYDTFHFRKFQSPAPNLEIYEFKLIELMKIFGPFLFEGSKPIFINDEINLV